LSLCAPAPGLSCFRCCPPLRPAGYDHADHRGPLRRLFSDNRAAFLRGELPRGPVVGFSCPGLGFLDSRGRTVGCLLHPARNQGRDLRRLTGYAEKCARESCPQARAFAALEPGEHEALLEPCRGMDSFQFSSPRLNPLMRLLALGPGVARAAAGLGPGGLRLEDLEPAWGWLLQGLIRVRGPEVLQAPDLAGRLGALARELARRLGPFPPLERGELLYRLASEWEARFWQWLSRARRCPARELARWRDTLARLLEEQKEKWGYN